jgi:(2Fe-2S) ferredoxin
MPKYNKEMLESIRAKAQADQGDYISVGMSACGIAAGAEEVYNTFAEQIKTRKFNVKLKKCGCAGMCYVEPLVEVKVAGLPTVTYGKVNKEIAIQILGRHIGGKKIVEDYVVKT